LTLSNQHQFDSDFTDLFLSIFINLITFIALSTVPQMRRLISILIEIMEFFRGVLRIVVFIMWS